MKKILFITLTLVFAAVQSQACKTASLEARNGIWEITEGDDKCPNSLEIRCEEDERSGHDVVFIDEITDDNAPGAQIYFPNINARELDIKSEISANEKEKSTFTESDKVLTSSYKKCRGLLGCWGAYKVRHKMQFKNSSAILQKMWGETKACTYQRVSRLPGR